MNTWRVLVASRPVAPPNMWLRRRHTKSLDKSSSVMDHLLLLLTLLLRGVDEGLVAGPLLAEEVLLLLGGPPPA